MLTPAEILAHHKEHLIPILQKLLGARQNNANRYNVSPFGFSKKHKEKALSALITLLNGDSSEWVIKPDRHLRALQDGTTGKAINTYRLDLVKQKLVPDSSSETNKYLINAQVAVDLTPHYLYNFLNTVINGACEKIKQEATATPARSSSKSIPSFDLESPRSSSVDTADVRASITRAQARAESIH